MMEERAFNKEYSTYFDRARHTHGVRYIRCRVSAVREDPATGNLILRYAEPGGHPREEQFEMVVLSVGLQPPDSARHFTRMLDLHLNEHGFCETYKFSPLQTTHSGVFVCGAFSSPKEISETIIDASGAAAEVMRLLNDRLNSYPYTREYPFLAASDLPPERDTCGESPRASASLAVPVAAPCPCSTSPGSRNRPRNGRMSPPRKCSTSPVCPRVSSRSRRIQEEGSEPRRRRRLQQPDPRLPLSSEQCGTPGSTRTCWSWSTCAINVRAFTATSRNWPTAKRSSWSASPPAGCGRRDRCANSGTPPIPKRWSSAVASPA
jgi:hypothetical protein